MKPPFAYYGGKMRLAPWIASLLPAHRVYLEPFCGSCAVLFAKPPAPFEVINDRLAGLVTFFRILRDHPEHLEHVCRLTPFARDEFLHANYDEPGLTDLERARRFFVRTTQGFNQVPSLTSRSTWASSSRRGGSMPNSTQRTIDRFTRCAERLLNVSIDNTDAVTFIKRYEDRDAVIYADPPYLGSTRSRARDYGVEFAEDVDHQALAEVLRATPATVLLSGYSSPLYEELYGDWHTISRTIHAPSGNHGKSGRSHRTEFLWCNRPLDEGRLELEVAT